MGVPNRALPGSSSRSDKPIPRMRDHPLQTSVRCVSKVKTLNPPAFSRLPPRKGAAEHGQGVPGQLPPAPRCRARSLCPADEYYPCPQPPSTPQRPSMLPRPSAGYTLHRQSRSSAAAFNRPWQVPEYRQGRGLYVCPVCELYPAAFSPRECTDDGDRRPEGWRRLCSLSAGALSQDSQLPAQGQVLRSQGRTLRQKASHGENNGLPYAHMCSMILGPCARSVV